MTRLLLVVLALGLVHIPASDLLAKEGSKTAGSKRGGNGHYNGVKGGQYSGGKGSSHKGGQSSPPYGKRYKR